MGIVSRRTPAAILTVIGLLFYRTASVTESRIITLAIIPVALTVIMIVLSCLKTKFRFLNLTATVCAILLAWTLVLSFIAQLDPLGWWIAGLYTYSQVRGFIYFAVLVCVATLLDVVASFIDLHKAA